MPFAVVCSRKAPTVSKPVFVARLGSASTHAPRKMERAAQKKKVDALFLAHSVFALAAGSLAFIVSLQ